MAVSTLAEFLSKLSEPSGQRARERFCGEVAAALDSSGRALWAFGLGVEPAREGLALITQMAASLASGASLLYSNENWYSGACVVRQLVEAEYLLFLSSIDQSEVALWRQSTYEQRRKLFSPAKMRERSAGRFRSSEYHAHCERGGHPSPLGAAFLPEHQSEVGSNVWLWVDLAQHLERLWSFFEGAVEIQGGVHVRSVTDARANIAVAAARWHAIDPCASWVVLDPESS